MEGRDHHNAAHLYRLLICRAAATLLWWGQERALPLREQTCQHEHSNMVSLSVRTYTIWWI